MDTRQLDEILRCNEDTAGTFVGVYALDELASVASVRIRQRDRWFLVCNCCPSSQRGRHWVAIFYERGEVEFFDSFGLPPIAYDQALLAFLHSLTTQRCDVTYNNVPLQAFDSDACGHYCVLYGAARSRGDTFWRVVSDMCTLTRDTFIKFIVNTLLV